MVVTAQYSRGFSLGTKTFPVGCLVVGGGWEKLGLKRSSARLELEAWAELGNRENLGITENKETEENNDNRKYKLI